MPLIPTSEVWFDRDSRQRRDLGDITSLKTSIARLGLLNPLIIDRNCKLIAGERRLSACKELGLAQVEVKYLEDLSESESELVELDENIKRLDLPWQDRVLAIQRYHRLALAEGNSASFEDTAKDVGLTRQHVAVSVGLAEAIESGDAAISEASKFSVAQGIMERRRARARDSEDDLIAAALNEPTSATEEATAVAVAAPADDDDDLQDLEFVIPFANADFHIFARTNEVGPYNFIHCDFPYGIQANEHDQGAAESFGGYEDTFENYEQLLKSLAVFTERSVSDSAHLMFWFSMNHYQFTKVALERMGWRVNPTPLIWFKSDNSGILPDSKRGPRQVYETAFMASRGDRFIVRAKSNAVTHPNKKEIHMSEKPSEMLRHFFEMFVDENTVMFDPTCGSASALAVADALGAASVFGLEANPEFFKLAADRWREHYAE